MIRKTSLLFVLIFWLTGGAFAQDGGVKAVVGGYLIDGNGGEPIDDSVVLIEGNEITEVGTVDNVNIPDDAKRIDANGYTVMPGLNDAHVHTMIVGHGKYSEYFNRYYHENDQLYELMKVSASQLLDAGVTSARDLAAPLDEIISLREGIEKGEIEGPRMFVSGPFIQKTTGQVQSFFRLTVEGADDARAKAQRLVDAGVDLLKVAEASEMTQAEREAISEVADENDLPIAAHGYTPEALRAAVEMGASSIEHVNARPVPRYTEESVELMARNGVDAVVTSVVSKIYNITLNYPERLDNQRLESDLSASAYEDVRQSIEHPSRLGYFDQKKEINKWHDDKIRQLYDGGVRVTVGSDSGTPMNFHYESTWQEMKLLVEYGIPPMRVISAATRYPAELYGVGDKLGTVEPGKLADIIVVDGNPLSNMESLSNVVHVIKGGKIYR